MRGPANIRFSKIVDPVSGELQAYSLLGSYGRPRTIWMDGREHPSDLAPQTLAGFSTGRSSELPTLLSPTTNADAWGNCRPAQIIDELGGRPKSWVAHYLPGQTSHVQ